MRDWKPLPLGIPAVEEVAELQKALDSASASGSSLCSAGLAPVAASINFILTFSCGFRRHLFTLTAANVLLKAPLLCVLVFLSLLCLFVFDAGFLCVKALTVLELTLETRSASALQVQICLQILTFFFFFFTKNSDVCLFDSGLFCSVFI